MSGYIEFLENYKEQEHEEFLKFRKKVTEGKFTKNDRFPSGKRFIKFQEPVAIAPMNASVWGVVPFYGSTVIPLVPRNNKKEFDNLPQYKKMGLNSRSLDRFIDMVKDTGRIQFVLNAYPTEYSNLEFLEPLFTELKPPLGDYLLEATLGDKTFLQYAIEFDTISNFGFKKYVASETELIYPGASLEYIQKRIFDYSGNYVSFKALGLNSLVKEIEELMLLNPSGAGELFHIFGSLLAYPTFDSLRPIFNHEVSLLKEAKNRGKGHGLEIQYQPSYEIGKFILDKLIFYPETLDGCKEIIQYYDDNDLASIVKSLNTGVKEEELDVIECKQKELSDILENIWSETDKIKSKSVGLSAGITLSIGVVGTLSTGLPGVGILAGLGFQSADRLLGIKLESLSEKMVKCIFPNHLITIYDFKNKYKL